MNNKIEDLAKEAGVSTKTISRYFNNPDIVSDTTKKKIDLAINKLGFVENKVAKSLATGTTEYIGVIVPNLELSYFGDLINRITLYAIKYNYKCIIYVSKRGRGGELKFLNEMAAHKVKGVINFSHELRAQELENINLNIVAVEREIGNYNYIICDNYLGGQKAAQHFIDNHCEKFLHINGPYYDHIPAAKRYDGFRSIIDMTKYNELIIEDIDQKENEHYLHEYLEKNIGIEKTGIFCANDNVARIVINYLFIKGYKVPEDVMVIGFDNSSISKNSIIPITTLDQQLDTITALSVDTIINDYSDIKTVLTPELIVRKSTNNK